MAWAPDYASAAELAAYMAIDDTIDNAQLALDVAAASRAVDRAAHRQFGKTETPETRYFTARWNRKRGRWIVPIDDLPSIAGLTVRVDSFGDGDYDQEITEYRLKPLNATAEGEPWTQLVVNRASLVQPNGCEGGVEVVADEWGWAAVPATVKDATLLQGSRFATRRQAPLGVAGSPELGSEIRLMAKVDPDVAVMLQPYTRWWAVR